MSLHPCVLCITLHAEASQSSTSGSVAARGVHGAAGVNDKTTIFPLATRNRGQISAPRQAARASATQAGTCSARAQLSSAGPGSESSNRAWRRPPCCAGAAARAPARPRRRQQRRPRRRLRRAPRSAPPAPPARPRAPHPPRAPARRTHRHAAPGLATGNCRQPICEPGARLCQLAPQQPSGRAGRLVGARQLGLQLVHLRARSHSCQSLARPSAACARGGLFLFIASLSEGGRRGDMSLQCCDRAASAELTHAGSALGTATSWPCRSRGASAGTQLQAGAGREDDMAHHEKMT